MGSPSSVCVGAGSWLLAREASALGRASAGSGRLGSLRGSGSKSGKNLLLGGLTETASKASGVRGGDFETCTTNDSTEES